MTADLIPLETIMDAAEKLAGKAVETPLLESAVLNEQLGARILFKPECLQVTGSFKFRGAFTKMTRLTPAERDAGVVAFSSGNHAQGVAAAAKMMGCKATIVMPSDAPDLKIDNTRGYGAEVILYDRYKEDRALIAQRISEESGATLIPPYDDRDIMTGQGTVGLELSSQAAALGVTLDSVICPVGGGGLIGGLSSALKARSPDTEIWCSEPAGYDDTIRSLAAGERVSNAPTAPSICDSIVTERPGALTFAVNKQTLSGGFAVSQEDVIDAMRAMFEKLKLVVEPGSATSFAALATHADRFRGQTVAVILSGGNIGLSDFCRLCA